MSTTSKIIYAIAFQLGWFVCILAGNWISLGYAIVFLGLHLGFVSRTTENFSPRKEALWIILVFAFGLILETISFSAGFLYSNTPVNLFERLQLPPLWLLNLWILLSIALRTCLSFLFYKPKLAYLLFSIAIPLNYYAGAKLNLDVSVNSPYTLSLALITLLWIGLLWFLIHIRHYYFGDIFNAD